MGLLTKLRVGYTVNKLQLHPTRTKIMKMLKDNLHTLQNRAARIISGAEYVSDSKISLKIYNWIHLMFDAKS